MKYLNVYNFIYCLFFTLTLTGQTITVQNLDDSGIGSLRDAIDIANSGDTIRFNPMLLSQGSDTLVLDTVINIDKDLVIKGLYDDEDTLFLSAIDDQMMFSIDSVENIVMDSLTFDIGSINTFTNYDFFWVRNSNIQMYNSMFLGYRDEVLTFWQSSLEILNCKFTSGNSLFPSSVIIFLTNGDVSRQFRVVNSEFRFNNPLTSAVIIKTGGNKNNNHIYFENNYFSNIGTLVYGHNMIDIFNSTYENAHIQTGEPSVGFAYIRDITLNIESSTFTINDVNQVQNTILCIGTPYGPIEPVPLDVLELNFTNCTFNGGIYVDTVYNNFYDSNYLDYFGPDLDELKITSCIFNDINGFNELPIDTSGGYNLFSFPQNIGLDSTDQADILVSDINLGSLQNNGGSTPTHLPSFQSLAFNSGNPNDTSSAQNGDIVQRRDIGAAEIQAVLTVDTTEYCGETYQWREEILTESNIHFDVQESTTGGYDSVFVLDLTLDYIDAIAISDGGELKANISDATYQWIDCSTNQPLFGETNQVLTPSTEGIYAVIVSSSICTDTSSCVYINNIGLEEQEKHFVFVKDKILYLNNVNSYTEYSVYNNLGQIVFKFNTVKKQQDITHLNSGVYFIEFKDENIQPVKFILD